MRAAPLRARNSTYRRHKRTTLNSGGIDQSSAIALMSGMSYDHCVIVCEERRNDENKKLDLLIANQIKSSLITSSDVSTHLRQGCRNGAGHARTAA